MGYLLSMAVGATVALLLVAAHGALGPRDQVPVTVAPEAVQPAVPAGQILVERANDVQFEKNGVRERARPGMRQPLAAGESGAIIIGDSRTEVTGPGVVEFNQGVGAAAGWQVRFSPSESKTDTFDVHAPVDPWIATGFMLVSASTLLCGSLAYGGVRTTDLQD